MNPEISKFLTEFIGETWHYTTGDHIYYCEACKYQHMDSPYRDNPDFSTWEGFGLLWEACIKKEWFDEFIEIQWKVYKIDQSKIVDNFIAFLLDYINPTKFAEAVYEYLQKGDGK